MSTALILEDDVDWSPQLRSQLSTFALASHRLPAMIADVELIAHDYVPAREIPAGEEPDPVALAKRSTLRLPSTSSKSSSHPYDDTWDVLWLGHCGTSLPPHQRSLSSSHPPDRLMLLNDATVPHPEELVPNGIPPPNGISSLYPAHTRVYHRAHNTLCTLAYAVTQRGARRILYEHGIRNFNKGYDFALGEWCDGTTQHMGDKPVCLTSSPTVFSHFWGTGGGKSDIMGAGMDGVESGIGKLVKSVRGGLEELVEGDLL
jgi:hypothetical protein